MNTNKMIEASGRSKAWALGFAFPTEEVCLEAVKRDGDALQYVKDQTEEVCLEAVKSNGYALQYVDFTQKKNPQPRRYLRNDTIN